MVNESEYLDKVLVQDKMGGKRPQLLRQRQQFCWTDNGSEPPSLWGAPGQNS